MKSYLKVFLTILVFALISVSLYFILSALNITSINQLREIIQQSGNFAFFTYLIVQTLVLVVFCFIPEINSALIVLGVVLFRPWIAFLLCLLSVFIADTILFFMGDKFGEKLLTKLIGKQELDRIQNLIDTKSKVFLPVMFLIPAIPDEALCLVIGMTKIKYWYFILVSIVYHSLEIGLFCFFGSGLINWSALSLFDWIVLVNIVLIDIYLLLKFEKYLDNKMKTKK